MAYEWFENAVNNGMIPTPNDMYRHNQQAFINEQWENTSAKTPENGGAIMEQSAIGSSAYNCIEAWVKPTVADVSRGQTDTRDFMKLIFKCIDHTTTRGLFYQFDGCYWIVHSYNQFNGLAQDVGIRRCNNYLRIVDSDNGSVFSIPCVIDYDMMSPNVQTSRYIITPNGHVTVITQGNTDTLRLFRLNTRYIIDGRPFKLNSYQNTLEYSNTNQQTTILYLDLYLDEEHAEDDMVNQVAYNGDYTYDVSIDSANLQVVTGTTGKLTASVTLNGTEVDKQVEWTSNNSAVTIDSYGNYTVNGSVGTIATITSNLVGNKDAKDTITITIASVAQLQPKIIVEPMFDKIRQYETINFVVKMEYNGVLHADVQSTITCNSDAVVIIKNGYNYSITGNKVSQDDIVMLISGTIEETQITTTKNVTIHAVSMMG